jgi:hypothetical protein
MLLIKKGGIGELRQDGLIVLPLGRNDASPTWETHVLIHAYTYITTEDLDMNFVSIFPL